jgi:hypothetical protein
MPKILFTKRHEVERADGIPNDVYREGQIIDVKEGSARHFVSRGVAEYVEETGRGRRAADPSINQQQKTPAPPNALHPAGMLPPIPHPAQPPAPPQE